MIKFNVFVLEIFFLLEDIILYYKLSKIDNILINNK